MKYTNRQIQESINHWTKLLEDLDFDGFFSDGNGEQEKEDHYFVVVLRNKNTAESMFTFIEANGLEAAKSDVKKRFKDYDIVKIAPEKNDASFILKSLGLQPNDTKRV